jgi:hypothetical protein
MNYNMPDNLLVNTHIVIYNSILFKKVCKVQKDDFCEINLTKTQNELYTNTNY